MIKELTTENFKEEVASEQKTLVDFWAPWCGPCKMLSPIVDEIAETATDFKVGKVNVDEQMDIAREFSIAAIPTLLVFQNGKVINKSVGLLTKDEVLDLLK
ncbi:MAG: thioredoxin [Candidatus Borkfalkiaceae bacterium]|nr:thioredoxin [Christensenellaceae bacterium]